MGLEVDARRRQLELERCSLQAMLALVGAKTVNFMLAGLQPKADELEADKPVTADEPVELAAAEAVRP